MTTPSPPYPGFEPPSPRTWAQGDIITTPRLRGDMSNLAAMFAGGPARPVLLSINTGGTSVAPTRNTDSQVAIGNRVTLNTWNVPVQGTSPVTAYQIPMPGWYLLQGTVVMRTTSSSNQARYATGFSFVQNGTAQDDYEGGSVAGASATTTHVGASVANLVEFNSYAASLDTAALYILTNVAAPGTIVGTYLMAEWVGLPSSTSGLINYYGPFGTVVNSPKAAVPFPPGEGTTLSQPVAAGGTAVIVASSTGMIAGGVIGLDWLNSQPYQQYAEAVTITDVTSGSIGITAAAFGHSSGAPVAVPISAALMNQQCRDAVNFLSYPPMLDVTAANVQSIASTTFPASVQVTGLSPLNTTYDNIDNFAGFGTASSNYIVPVSGVYLTYGQVPLVGTTVAFSAACGVSVNGATTLWGDQSYANTTSGAQAVCPTFRRHLRLTAGSTVSLQAFQDSGGSMATYVTGNANPALIMLWRST